MNKKNADISLQSEAKKKNVSICKYTNLVIYRKFTCLGVSNSFPEIFTRTVIFPKKIAINSSKKNAKISGKFSV